MTQSSLFRLAGVGTIACLLGVWQLTAAQTAGDGALAFEVLPKSQKITRGKPVTLTFRVRNVGAQNALANRRFYLNHSVSLEITAASGQRAQWCGRLSDMLVTQDDFVILAPGSQVERTVRISCDNKGVGGYALAAPGEYVVKARYDLGLPPQALKAIAKGALVMNGPVEAQPVRIEVLPPR